MASCECGTRPSVEPCVRLLEAYGSSRPCTLNKTAVEAGRACRALTTCDASPCLPAWMSSTAVRETLVASSRRSATWLLFVGDSDTRGLVLMLLQLLADAGYGPQEAARRRELWLGEDVDSATGDVSYDASRLCHLDWLYTRGGQLLRKHAVPCRDAMSPGNGSDRAAEEKFLLRHSSRAANLSSRQRSATYRFLGRGYGLVHEDMAATGTAHAAGLRVTYILTTTRGQFIDTLRVIASTLRTLGSAQQRPSLLYCNQGAWYASGQPSVADLLAELAHFGTNHVMPRTQGGRLFWGTVVGHRMDGAGDKAVFATQIRAEAKATAGNLPTGWQLLSRDTDLSRLAGKGGYRGLRLSFHHQPHLVNYVDLQRLIQALRVQTDAVADAGGVDPIGSPATHQPIAWGMNASSPRIAPCHAGSTRVRVVFSPECAGLGAARKDRHFLEAYQHFCRVELHYDEL